MNQKIEAICNEWLLRRSPYVQQLPEEDQVELLAAHLFEKTWPEVLAIRNVISNCAYME